MCKYMCIYVNVFVCYAHMLIFLEAAFLSDACGHFNTAPAFQVP